MNLKNGLLFFLISGFFYICPDFVFANDIKEKLVYLPLTFYSETNPIKSSACIEVSERIYLEPKWWEADKGNLVGVEFQFEEVIDAMKKKNKDKLLELSDPIDGRDANEFNDQASEFFQQIEVVNIVEVPKSYIFDGLVVFLVKLDSNGKSAYITLVFAAQNDGTYKFLPYDTKHITYLIVNGWINAPWGMNSDSPAYCDAKTIKASNYKIPLGVLRNYGPSSFLYLDGSIFEDGIKPNRDMVKVNKFIDSIDRSDINDIEKFSKFFTSDFGASLKKWFKTATPSEKDQFKSQLQGQYPVFLINAKALYILYAKNSLGIQAWYLIPNDNGDLILSNMSHLTISDNVFKAGLLFDEANEINPFQKFKIVSP